MKRCALYMPVLRMTISPLFGCWKNGVFPRICGSMRLQRCNLGRFKKLLQEAVPALMQAAGSAASTVAGPSVGWSRQSPAPVQHVLGLARDKTEPTGLGLVDQGSQEVVGFGVAVVGEKCQRQE